MTFLLQFRWTAYLAKSSSNRDLITMMIILPERVAVAHRLGCKACEPHTCAWTLVGCMDYPAIEALPDNNVTVIWMTSYGERSSEPRSQQLKSQWAWRGMTTNAQMGLILPWARGKPMAWDVSGHIPGHGFSSWVFLCCQSGATTPDVYRSIPAQRTYFRLQSHICVL